MAFRFIPLRLLAPALAVTALGAVQLVAEPASPPVQTKPPAINVSPPPPLPAPTPAPVPTMVAVRESQPYFRVSPDGETMYMVGSILDDSFKRFDAALAKAPKVKTLHLASPGGLTLEARMMAALIRKRKLNTYVETYCASACTQLFVAGRERVIGKEAELGFHQAVAVDRRGRASRVNKATDRVLTPTTVFGVNGNDTLRLVYEQAGLDHKFIDKVLERNHSDMWYPSAKELTDAHVITRVAEKPEFPLPEGSISQADLRAKLLARPIWARADKLYHDTFESAMHDAWRLGNSGTDLDTAISSGRGDIILAMMSRFAQSSDVLLDRHLVLYATQAREEATKGYPACKSGMETVGSRLSDSDREFERSEDAILLAGFDAAPVMPVMSKKDAMKVFVKEIVPVLPDNFNASNTCKAGFQMIAAIDRLTGKHRVKAYRALLFLPDALNL